MYEVMESVRRSQKIPKNGNVVWEEDSLMNGGKVERMSSTGDNGGFMH
jgi:hypothetical protein